LTIEVADAAGTVEAAAEREAPEDFDVAGDRLDTGLCKVEGVPDTGGEAVADSDIDGFGVSDGEPVTELSAEGLTSTTNISNIRTFSPQW